MKRDIPHISGNPGIRSYIPSDKVEIPPDIPIKVDWQRPNPNEYFHKKVTEFNPTNLPKPQDNGKAYVTNGYDIQELEKYAMIGGGVLLIFLVLLKL